MNEVKNLSKFDNYSRRMTVFARESENHISVLTSAEMDIILFLQTWVSAHVYFLNFRFSDFQIRISELQIAFLDFRFTLSHLIFRLQFPIFRLRPSEHKYSFVYVNELYSDKISYTTIYFIISLFVLGTRNSSLLISSS